MQKWISSRFGQNAIRFLATGGFVGYLPKMPGTYGTIVGVGLTFLSARFFSPLMHMAFVSLFVFFSVMVCTFYESFNEGHDRQEVVIDEIAGFMVASMWIPLRWEFWLLAFVIFRILDMTKPYPISYLDEKIEGGLGVVVDDLAAGLATNILLQIVLRFFPQF